MELAGTSIFVDIFYNVSFHSTSSILLIAGSTFQKSANKNLPESTLWNLQ
jgi:hypothetical protein